MGSIHPAVSEICVPQSLDPICTKFDKFLGHGQAHLGQMGKWLWRCTTTGLDNSTELRMEKIHQAVTEIWVPQFGSRPPGRPAARTVTTIPLQPGGLRGKKPPFVFHCKFVCAIIIDNINHYSKCLFLSLYIYIYKYTMMIKTNYLKYSVWYSHAHYLSYISSVYCFTYTCAACM